MSGDSSLAGLLALLLDVPIDAPVAATPNFAPWLGATAHAWPPADGRGLWLIDTRDRVARSRELRRTLTGGGFDAALIVSAAPRQPLRRLAQRLRNPGCSRLPPGRVRPLVSLAQSAFVQVMGFDEGCHAPTDFTFERGAAEGAAFLLTRRPPFRGELWTRLTQMLDGAELTVLWFDLRDRGAAVIAVDAGGSSYVVRVVPDAGLQHVVRRNHTTITELRRLLADENVEHLVPRPVAIETWRSTLIMAETRLPGVLAWKVARDELAQRIHANALRFLDSLQRATLRSEPFTPDELGHLLQAERDRIDAAAFAPRGVRARLQNELSQSGSVLRTVSLKPHFSHGDFGYGNLLVAPQTGDLLGVIDWDTARHHDLPGIDRVNLELQLARAAHGSFASAVRVVWEQRLAHDALLEHGTAESARALFGLAVCRYVSRSLAYPEIFRQESEDFDAALARMADQEGAR